MFWLFLLVFVTAAGPLGLVLWALCQFTLWAFDLEDDEWGDK